MAHTGTYKSTYTGLQLEKALILPQDIIAESYDSSASYILNDVVINEGVLYQCITATTGTFDSTKWNVIKVFDNDNHTIFTNGLAMIDNSQVGTNVNLVLSSAILEDNNLIIG